MTVPRHQIVEPESVGYYHCIARCVRRAFLCGFDHYSGIDFEHRREWIRSRLMMLLEIFAIELVAYAVMMNHLHSLLKIRPDTASIWSAEEVARRWRMLFPRRWIEGKPAPPTEEEISEITNKPELVSVYRKRLSSVSWFNRCLNEHIARMANAEDQVKGRFWEGRFRCQRLQGAASILACSAYIDLNPIRAGIAKTPETSDFTSIQDRIEELNEAHTGKQKDLPRLVSIPEVFSKQLTVEDYISIVDSTGRLIISGKGSIPSHLSPILERTGLRSHCWVRTVSEYRSMFKRVVATADQLKVAGQKVGLLWFQGIAAARRTFAM